MRIEVLNNGEVTNTVICESLAAAQDMFGTDCRVAAEQSVPIQAQRHISVGAFYDRFGSAKWGILADTTPSVVAVIRDASVRAYIDLDNAQLPMGLHILTDAGHSIDEDAVLHAPVLESEKP